MRGELSQTKGNTETHWGEQQQERFATIWSRWKLEGIIVKASKQRELQERTGQSRPDSGNSQMSREGGTEINSLDSLFSPFISRWQCLCGPKPTKSQMAKESGFPWRSASWYLEQNRQDWRGSVEGQMEHMPESWWVRSRGYHGVETSLQRAGGNGGNVRFPSTLSCPKLALIWCPIVHMRQVAFAAGGKESVQAPDLWAFKMKYLHQGLRCKNEQELSPRATLGIQ